MGRRHCYRRRLRALGRLPRERRVSARRIFLRSDWFHVWFELWGHEVSCTSDLAEDPMRTPHLVACAPSGNTGPKRGPRRRGRDPAARADLTADRCRSFSAPYPWKVDWTMCVTGRLPVVFRENGLASLVGADPAAVYSLGRPTSSVELPAGDDRFFHTQRMRYLPERYLSDA